MLRIREALRFSGYLSWSNDRFSVGLAIQRAPNRGPADVHISLERKLLAKFRQRKMRLVRNEPQEELQSLVINLRARRAVACSWPRFDAAGFTKQSHEVPHEAQAHRETRGDLALRFVTALAGVVNLHANVKRVWSHFACCVGRL